LKKISTKCILPLGGRGDSFATGSGSCRGNYSRNSNCLSLLPGWPGVDDPFTGQRSPVPVAIENASNSRQRVLPSPVATTVRPDDDDDRFPGSTTAILDTIIDLGLGND
jgi:hypothetical protein